MSARRAYVKNTGELCSKRGKLTEKHLLATLSSELMSRHPDGTTEFQLGYALLRIAVRRPDQSELSAELAKIQEERRDRRRAGESDARAGRQP